MNLYHFDLSPETVNLPIKQLSHCLYDEALFGVTQGAPSSKDISNQMPSVISCDISCHLVTHLDQDGGGRAGEMGVHGGVFRDTLFPIWRPYLEKHTAKGIGLYGATATLNDV